MTNNANAYQQVIAKCWADDAFKQRLIADPAAVIRAEGMDLPEGMQIEVRENTDQQFYLVIPPPPSELSDEQIDAVGGGFCHVCHCAHCLFGIVEFLCKSGISRIERSSNKQRFMTTCVTFE